MFNGIPQVSEALLIFLNSLFFLFFRPDNLSGFICQFADSFSACSDLLLSPSSEFLICYCTFHPQNFYFIPFNNFYLFIDLFSTR